jgi:hypothetical protein
MPKATLAFSLPEEQSEFDSAMQGARAKSALWDIDQICRSLVKYGEPSPSEIELAQRIRAMIPAELLDS